MRFLYYYLRSMRLYYGFVTGGTTLLGAAAAHEFGGNNWSWRDAVILSIGFLAWGVNQIFNDWHDRKADRINAPHRPMVTGQLAAKPALALSVVMMLLFAALSVTVTPWLLLPIAAGGILNLLYSKWKHIPVLNCLIYGASITMCVLFGWIGVTLRFPQQPWELLLPPLISLAVLPAHMLMCHNSYFKDVTGDRAAGVRTLPMMYSRRLILSISRFWTLAYSFAIFMLASIRGSFLAGGILFLWLAFLCFLTYKNLKNREYHRATRSNCLLCVSWIFGIMIVFLSAWWFPVLIVACILIAILYQWYPDEEE